MRQLQACKVQSLQLQADLDTCRNQFAGLQSQMKVSCLLVLGCSSHVQARRPRSSSKMHGAVNQPSVGVR